MVKGHIMVAVREEAEVSRLVDQIPSEGTRARINVETAYATRWNDQPGVITIVQAANQEAVIGFAQTLEALPGVAGTKSYFA